MSLVETLLGVGLPVMTLVGYGIGRRNAKVAVPSTECTHIVWGPWEETTIYGKWYGPNYKRQRDEYPGQKRSCMNCGFTETERL